MADNWVKALGIDYGKARIGLATSDDLGMFAHPLCTISGKPGDQPEAAILKIVQERGIREIVIGLPLYSSGAESEMSREVRAFVGRLREILGSDFPIHWMDELMTTRTAREKLQQAGKKLKDQKAILDQAAAVEILQEWLNQRSHSLFPIEDFPEEER
jgi:putative holliday junction resolvase